MVRDCWFNSVMCRVASVFIWGDCIEAFLLFSIIMSIAVAFFAVALRLRSAVQTEKRKQGIPEGLVLYSDLNVPAEPLFSQRLRLSGKPDYIVQKESQYIPVEVKTGRQGHPQHSHVLQLAAYCQLIEETSGMFVPEGILVYNKVPYTIPFDPKLRFELQNVIRLMRSSLRNGTVERNHVEPGRCRSCSMKRYCSKSLLQGPLF
jgi:CRISPR-associated exonuclease Cas4